MLELLCGENVIIGIIDQGFDYTHPMYFDTKAEKNRIMWVWELENNGNPPAGYNYGSYLSDYSQIIDKGWDYPFPPLDANTKLAIDKNHGTGVSGIATGSGAPYNKSNKYRGIAPCANIILVSFYFTSDPIAFSASQSQYKDAINLIFQTADNHGMPAVINCS